MTREELKQAALSLPMEPGVYLMKDKANTVIYVGKAKKLKNRVSQYFQDSGSHSMKTRRILYKATFFTERIHCGIFTGKRWHTNHDFAGCKAFGFW